ncbi:MAG TPA: VTT domain-containing protein [Candidatus Saccharimonadales bacterium]|nr:VTT domain-containing protein [Candidatus Saccharimonadales bacterium]
MALVLSGWKQKIVAFAGSLGAPGLLLISFLDSSVLSFPVINDLLLIQLSVQNPKRMPLYAAMASLGSVLGCVLLYYIARAGGEAYFHRKAGTRALHIRSWVERNGFGGILAAALLPPPTPFKIFVFAAGVFEVPVVSFTLAVTIARLVRYFLVGYLAIRYGNQALPYIKTHWPMVLIGAVVFVGACYGLSRVLIRHHVEDARD